MIPGDVAKAANRLLGVALVALVEGVEPLTVSVQVHGEEDHNGALRQVGEDVATLAAAMQVLTRRSVSNGGLADGV